MTSRDEIIHLINSYCFMLDGGDLDGWAGLFEDGEWGPEDGVPIKGKQAMLDMIKSIIILYPCGTPRTRHLMSNIDLVIDEDQDLAKCQSYVTVVQQTEDLPLQIIVSVGYEDTFKRVAGKWIFAKRITTRPMMGDVSAHIKMLPS